MRAVFFLLAHEASALTKEFFTTNAVCSAKYCINPVFPGLEDLYSLGKAEYQCSDLDEVAPSLAFCEGIVNYNPSLQKPEKEGTAADMVHAAEQKAMTTYFYHLNAMGLEGWDFTSPKTMGDPCAESIWRMVCFTYFPRAPKDCKKGDAAAYIRPCMSSCENYISQCKVECCDESVQCTFEHSKKLSNDETIQTTGYSPHSGPNMLCTGSASSRDITGVFVILLLALGLNMNTREVKRVGSVLGFFAVVTAVFSGIVPASALNLDVSRSQTLAPFANGTALVQTSAKGDNDWAQVPSHQVGNWRSKPDYLIKFQYIPPGSTKSDAILNSCSLSNLAQTLQCNGRGMCKSFNKNNIGNPVNFCECERDYADPECRTKRRSQAAAYVLSLFFGMLGIDKFYLGMPMQGAAKLISFGGFTVWWVADIVNIGAAPVYASDYRVAADLPHWVFVLTSISFFMMVGFLMAFYFTRRHLAQRRRTALLNQADEDAQVSSFIAPAGKPVLTKPQPQVTFPQA